MQQFDRITPIRSSFPSGVRLARRNVSKRLSLGATFVRCNPELVLAGQDGLGRGLFVGGRLPGLLCFRPNPGVHHERLR
jgi:hypothetical protein